MEKVKHHSLAYELKYGLDQIGCLLVITNYQLFIFLVTTGNLPVSCQ